MAHSGHSITKSGAHTHIGTTLPVTGEVSFGLSPKYFIGFYQEGAMSAFAAVFSVFHAPQVVCKKKKKLLKKNY